MLFENPADCIVMKSVISDQQRLHMVDWLESQMDAGALRPNEVGGPRYYCEAAKLGDLPDFYPALKRHLARQLGISEFAEDEVLGDLLTCNEAGAQIHRHRDTADGDGRWHIRVNLYLQAAQQGGEPVLRGHQLDLEEGDAWAFVANETEHWNTPVGGDRRRLTFSYAMNVDRPDAMLAQFVFPRLRVKHLDGIAPLAHAD